MHKHLQSLITWANATLWITNGKSVKCSKTIVVYYHRAGLRIRNCDHTIWPYEYDKNTNQRPSHEATRNFNEWASDVKEALLPTQTIAEKRLKELKSLLNTVTVNK